MVKKRGLDVLRGMHVERQMDLEKEKKEIEELRLRFKKNNKRVGDALDRVNNISNYKEKIEDDDVTERLEKLVNQFHDVLNKMDTVTLQEDVVYDAQSVKKQEEFMAQLDQEIHEMTQLVSVSMPDEYAFVKKTNDNVEIVSEDVKNVVQDRRLDESVNIAALESEIDQLSGVLEEKIEDALFTLKDKNHAQKVRQLQSYIANKRARLNDIEKNAEKIIEMEKFADELYEYGKQKWSKDIRKDVLEGETNQEEKKRIERERYRFVHNHKPSWVESLPKDKQKRRNAIVARFPIDEDFIKFEKGFPVDDFHVERVVISNDVEDDQIVISRNGVKKKVSVYELDNLMSDERFVKSSQLEKRKASRNVKNATEEHENQLKKKLHSIRRIEELFSDEARERYFASFGELSKGGKKDKISAFKGARTGVLNELKSVSQNGEIDDIDAFVDEFLSRKQFYSKIREALKIKQNKAMINSFEQSQKLEIEKKLMENDLIDGVANGEEERDLESKQSQKLEVEKNLKENNLIDGVTTGEDERELENEKDQKKLNEEVFKDGWSEDEKKAFDKKWVEVAESKKGEKIEKKPDYNKFSQLSAAEQEAEWNRLHEEKYGKKDEKETLGLRNDEEGRLEKEVARRAESVGELNENTQKQGLNEKQEEALEQLKVALDDARGAYSRIHYKSEGLKQKIKNFFGSVTNAGDPDVDRMRSEYKQKIEAFRNAKIGKLEGLSESEQVKMLAELKEFDLNENINLYDSRVAAKAEMHAGGLGKIAHDVVLKYKGMHWKNKIALSGGLLVAGMAVGSTGVAAGLFGGAVLAKRGLGAAAAGIGATGWAEGRMSKKEQEGIQRALEQFRGLSLEEQKAHLLGFDNASFEKIEKNFHGKISGRSKRVVLGIGAAAGVMALGSVGKIFTANEIATPDNVSEGVFQASNDLEVTDVPMSDGSIEAVSADVPLESSVSEDQVNSVFSGEMVNETSSAPEIEGDVSNLETPIEGNVEAVGIFSGIDMDENGIGELKVNKGESIEGALIAFFAQNSEKLTEGGMGWDPDKFKDVNEWAGKRARGLVAEYMKAHPGIDMDTVQPGTTFDINLKDLADIRITEVDFEGGPRIVPEQMKVEIPNSENVVETTLGTEAQRVSHIAEKMGISFNEGTQMTYDGGVLSTIDGQEVPEEFLSQEEQRIKSIIDNARDVREISEPRPVLNTKDEIIAAFGMEEDQYAFFQNIPADQYIADLKTFNPNDESVTAKFDKILINLSEQGEIDLEGKSVADVMREVDLSDLPQESVAETVSEDVIPTEQATSVEQETPQSVDTSSVEITAQERMDAMRELAGNPAFREMIGTQMQEVFGGEDPINTMRNIGNAKIEFFQGVGTQGENLTALQARAVQTLGERGNPKAGETAGKYFFRIAANASREGNLKQVFPSSDFTA